MNSPLQGGADDSMPTTQPFSTPLRIVLLVQARSPARSRDVESPHADELIDKDRQELGGGESWRVPSYFPSSLLFGRMPLPNIRNRNAVTDAERLNDIEQKLRCWGYLSHYPDAERDMAWLLERLAEQGERITELEARLRRAEWASSAPLNAAD